MENSKKKSLKWLWITIALVVVAGIAIWCGVASTWGKDIKDKWGEFEKTQYGIGNILSISSFLITLFVIVVLGYMLGRITIKGVSLGTAGVFLVAILVGFLCTLIPEDIPVIGSLHLQAEILDKVNKEVIQSASKNLPYFKSVLQNVGLVLFVGSVGFIAGPKFFRDLAKNFKTYIFMGVIIILAGTVVSVAFALIPGIGSDFSAGVLSGALTSTPGYSAALEVSSAQGLVTLGHAIAYPFGVIGVVLFVQLMPKFLKADMNVERSLLKPEVMASTEKKEEKKLFKCDDFGLMPLALAIVCGLLIGAIKIPLTGAGYNGACFSLGTTGGVLIMCLVFGHFGRIGKLSLEVPQHSAKVLRELGLMLFLIGAGVDGGVSLVTEVANAGGGMIVVWGLLGGAVMTLTPMIVGFFVGGKMLKLPLLNNLGSITGGMTSTPALGTLISTAETEDVASAYASTYPIALVLIVLACNLMIGLI
ncbi:MAG: permease [Clostridia bacterium]|nr:permease [Clostridia bacterium]